MNNVLFFTNPYGNWPYHLISYKNWKKGYSKNYEKLIIDSGVNNLKGKIEYDYIKDYPLINLSNNVFWVIPDYPFDLKPNLTQDECIEKSFENIKKWSFYNNSISSVQYKFENFESFKDSFEEIYQLGSIIGIGNLCKSKNLSFLKKIVDYIILNNYNNKWIHFFGLTKKIIKYINSKDILFKISIDSMKWDFGLFKDRIGIKNTKIERWKYFLQYYKECFYLRE